MRFSLPRALLLIWTVYLVLQAVSAYGKDSAGLDPQLALSGSGPDRVGPDLEAVRQRSSLNTLRSYVFTSFGAIIGKVGQRR
jgi:hypothetical protein